MRRGDCRRGRLAFFEESLECHVINVNTFNVALAVAMMATTAATPNGPVASSLSFEEWRKGHEADEPIDQAGEVTAALCPTPGLRPGRTEHDHRQAGRTAQSGPPHLHRRRPARAAL